MAGKGFDLRTRMGSKYEVDQRAALFGNRYSSVKQQDDSAARAQGASVLEEQNDRHIEDLEAKVHSLREISLGISGAVRESRGVLSGMGDSMDTASRLVKGTTAKVLRLIDQNGGGYCCTMVFIFLGAFFLIWLLFGGVSTKQS